MKKKKFLCFSYYCFMQEEQEAKKKFPNEINFIINEKKAEKTKNSSFPCFSESRRTEEHGYIIIITYKIIILKAAICGDVLI